MKKLLIILGSLMSTITLAQNKFEITNIAFSKTEGHAVKINKYVTVTYDYISDGSEVQILVQPMFEGKPVAASSSLPSEIILNKKGSTVNSFTLTKEGEIDHLRFRIMETKTSLMLYEFIAPVNYAFKAKTANAQVAFEVEYESEEKAFLFGSITNVGNEPLTKMLVSLDFEKAEIKNIAGINHKKAEGTLILFSDLWRTPMKPNDTKDFVIELKVDSGFVMPTTCLFNNSKTNLILTGEEMPGKEEKPVEVQMTILSEWEDGCIVEFGINTNSIEAEGIAMEAELGDLQKIDLWGAELEQDSAMTFKTTSPEFGFIASTDSKKIKTPKTVIVNNEHVPLKTVNKSKGKQTKKPIVRDAVFAFELVNEGPTKVTIIDKEGNLVDTVFDDTIDAGFHTFRWTPQTLDEVLYFYKLESNGGVITGQIIY